MTKYSWNSAPQRCHGCGAPDSRDADHARGCPALPAVPRERLLALARQVEDAWIAQRERARAKGAAA